MEIVFEKQKGFSPEMMIRRCGYIDLVDHRTGKVSFVRRLGPYFYPRFHIYIIEEDKKVKYLLHLDQKRSSYEGTPAHSAEYDGEAVNREAERIKEIISKNFRNNISGQKGQLWK